MSYLQYWKLAYAPFDTSFFKGGSIEEAIARVGFLVSSRRRLGVLLGPSSVGKTVLLRNLRKPIAQAASANRPQIVYQSLLGLDVNEFYRGLSGLLNAGQSGFEKPVESDRWPYPSSSSWGRLQDCLNALKAANTQVVLLFDDISVAQELVLAGIHRILETTCPISCVLSVCTDRVGSLPSSLQERCQLRVDLPAWDLGQTADYFDFAIGNAKGRPGLFEAQAITRIHELSDGLPQRINRISELALVAGASKRIPRITSELADQVFQEFSLLQSDYMENIAT